VIIFCCEIHISNKQKHCQMLLQYYFLANNSATGGVKIQEQSKHNFWSKIKSKVYLPKKRKNTSYKPQPVLSIYTPSGITQHNQLPPSYFIIKFLYQMFHHKFMYHNWQFIVIMTAVTTTKENNSATFRFSRGFM